MLHAVWDIGEFLHMYLIFNFLYMSWAVCVCYVLVCCVSNLRPLVHNTSLTQALDNIGQSHAQIL